jgi:hypothetical protein
MGASGLSKGIGDLVIGVVIAVIERLDTWDIPRARVVDGSVSSIPGILVCLRLQMASPESSLLLLLLVLAVAQLAPQRESR